jgi:hypothetical protein
LKRLQAIKIDENYDIVSNIEDNKSVVENKFNDETDIKLDVNDDINITDKKEINSVLDKYIDELKKDNEEILFNNDYIRRFRIIILGFLVMVSIVVILKSISRITGLLK